MIPIIGFTSSASAASLQTRQFFYQQITPSALGQHPRIPLQYWTGRPFRLDPQVLPRLWGPRKGPDQEVRTLSRHECYNSSLMRV